MTRGCPAGHYFKEYLVVVPMLRISYFLIHIWSSRIYASLFTRVIVWNLICNRIISWRKSIEFVCAFNIIIMCVCMCMRERYRDFDLLCIIIRTCRIPLILIGIQWVQFSTLNWSSGVGPRAAYSYLRSSIQIVLF